MRVFVVASGATMRLTSAWLSILIVLSRLQLFVEQFTSFSIVFEIAIIQGGLQIRVSFSRFTRPFLRNTSSQDGRHKRIA